MDAMPNRSSIEDAVAEIREILRLDGADLVIGVVAVDHVEMALVLDGVDCLDCVMPRRSIEDILGQRLEEATSKPMRVELSDPREKERR